MRRNCKPKRKRPSATALNEFVKAACHLEQEWVEAGSEGYPFPDSFDEVINQLILWRDAVNLASWKATS